MADKQSETVEVPVEDGQTETASTEQAVEVPKSDTVTKEDFQKMQSVLDRQIAAEKKRNAELAAKVNELSLANIPEEQREAAVLRSQLEQQQAELAQYQRESALRNLGNEYGVPYEVLQDADTPQVAWGLAMNYMRDQLRSGQAPQAAPTLSPSSSAPPFVAPQQAGSNKVRDWKKEFDDAMAAGDVRAYNKVRREYDAAHPS